VKPLIVSGLFERVNDGGPIWTIADAIDADADMQAAGVGQCDRRQWDTLAPADLYGRDFVGVYSYGMAALWHAMHAFAPDQRPSFKHLFIIAGVPRVWWGQLYGGVWTIPPQIMRATAFNTEAWVLPACASISNPSPDYINLNVGRAWDHMTIPSCPLVTQTIIEAIKAEAIRGAAA